MFARFDENPAVTLRVIKETKRYGRTHAQMDGWMDGQRENSIPTTKKFAGGIITVTFDTAAKSRPCFGDWLPVSYLMSSKRHLKEILL